MYKQAEFSMHFCQALLLAVFSFPLIGLSQSDNSVSADTPPTQKQGDQRFRIKTEVGSGASTFRNGASSLLEVNIAAVTKDGELDPTSPEWEKLSLAVQEVAQLERRNNLLHVRFFVSKGDVASLTSLGSIKTNIKKVLANVDTYLVCVDVAVRNDGVTWSEYVNPK